MIFPIFQEFYFLVPSVDFIYLFNVIKENVLIMKDSCSTFHGKSKKEPVSEFGRCSVNTAHKHRQPSHLDNTAQSITYILRSCDVSSETYSSVCPAGHN